MNSLDNPNPEVKVLTREPSKPTSEQTFREKIFDVIRDIRDPEHPHSLEELSVIDIDSISIAEPTDDGPGYGTVSIQFTPTVPHCSLGSIIGLSIQTKLSESNLLKPRGEHYYKLQVTCADGTHVNADDISRQLTDKERIAAASENPRIMGLIRSCTDNLPG